MTLLLALALFQPVTRPVPADTVDLGALRSAAAARDPRAVQPEILARAARLRIEAVRTEALPQLALTGQATAQSDVPSIPVQLPDGTTPAAPKEQVRAQVEADWAVYDGGRRGLRVDLEEARLDEATAGVAVALYGLRDATTEAYFGALLFQARAATLALTADDLDARLRLLRRQAEDGAALAADADAVEAELIRVRQQVDEAQAARRAALAVLRDLTGVALGPAAVLALPDLRAEIALQREGAVLGEDAVADVLTLESDRPEFSRFRAQAARANAEARLAGAATRPTISLFGQAGIGRPSPFDFLSDETQEYAQVGVRVRWTPVDYGRSRREAQAARLQADVARTEADALARRLRRDVEDDLAEIDRLRAAAPQDDRAIALREEAARVARRQLDEGVVLPDVYTDRLTDLADARLARERHRIELARAQARLLSTLGLYPEAPPSRLDR